MILLLTGLPITVSYWMVMSRIGGRVDEKIKLPGLPLDHYIEIKSDHLKQYEGKKIPMQIFHDAFFDGKVDFKGDVLEVMEWRHDWASFAFTPEVSWVLHFA